MNVERMQVIQERRDVVRVLVVPADLAAGIDRAAILANAAKKLPPTISVSVEVASELERSPSGKDPVRRQTCWPLDAPMRQDGARRRR